MKSIVFVIPNLKSGGAERVITTLINHIDKSEFTPTLVVFEKIGSYFDVLDKNIPVVELGIDRIRKAPFRLYKVLKKFNPDIVFMGYGELNAFFTPFIPFFKKTKFIARETSVVSKHVTRPEIKFFYKFYNNYDLVITQSEDMLEDLKRNFKIKSSKLLKINNPVDINFIQSSILKKEIEFEPKNAKHAVAVGSLNHRKGFDLLLTIFNELKEENIHLHLIGEGGDSVEALYEMKKEMQLSKVHFLGFQSNPYAYLAKADLFILSSRYEGFPNVLLESHTCGTYSLANDCPGGVNEIIIPKVNGERYSIEDVKGFADLVVSSLKENHKSESIIETVTNRYSLPIILDLYRKAFQSV